MRSTDVSVAAEILDASRHLVVLTGAGVSAESGVPTFRGPGGLWRSYRPEDLATPQAFARDPKLVWEWYDWRRSVLKSCRANRAHAVIAAWENRFPDFCLATQNVDGLHFEAGSKRAIELHGNIWRLRCTNESRDWVDQAVPLAELPPRCPSCGALARPAVVWFGESLPVEAIDRVSYEVGLCDVFLSCGTSSVVQPAASFGMAAVARGARVIEINIEETPLSSAAAVSLRAPAAEALPAIDALLTTLAGETSI